MLVISCVLEKQWVTYGRIDYEIRQLQLWQKGQHMGQLSREVDLALQIGLLLLRECPGTVMGYHHIASRICANHE